MISRNIAFERLLVLVSC